MKKHVFWSDVLNNGIDDGTPVKALCGYSKVVTIESAHRAQKYPACRKCLAVAMRKHGVAEVGNWVPRSFRIAVIGGFTEWKYES